LSRIDPTTFFDIIKEGFLNLHLNYKNLPIHYFFQNPSNHFITFRIISDPCEAKASMNEAESIQSVNARIKKNIEKKMK